MFFLALYVGSLFALCVVYLRSSLCCMCYAYNFLSMLLVCVLCVVHAVSCLLCGRMLCVVGRVYVVRVCCELLVMYVYVCCLCACAYILFGYERVRIHCLGVCMHVCCVRMHACIRVRALVMRVCRCDVCALCTLYVAGYVRVCMLCVVCVRARSLCMYCLGVCISAYVVYVWMRIVCVRVVCASLCVRCVRTSLCVCMCVRGRARVCVLFVCTHICCVRM